MRRQHDDVMLRQPALGAGQGHPLRLPRMQPRTDEGPWLPAMHACGQGNYQLERAQGSQRLCAPRRCARQPASSGADEGTALCRRPTEGAVMAGRGHVRASLQPLMDGKPTARHIHREPAPAGNRPRYCRKDGSPRGRKRPARARRRHRRHRPPARPCAKRRRTRPSTSPWHSRRPGYLQPASSAVPGSSRPGSRYADRIPGSPGARRLRRSRPGGSLPRTECHVRLHSRRRRRRSIQARPVPAPPGRVQAPRRPVRDRSAVLPARPVSVSRAGSWQRGHTLQDFTTDEQTRGAPGLRSSNPRRYPWPATSCPYQPLAAIC